MNTHNSTTTPSQKDILRLVNDRAQEIERDALNALKTLEQKMVVARKQADQTRVTRLMTDLSGDTSSIS